MFIYANELHLGSNASASYEQALRSVSNWLNSRFKADIQINDRSSGLDWEIREDSKQLKVWHTERDEDIFPWMSAVEFSHPDRSVSGRKWIAQVGIKKQSLDENTFITILLETSDISAEVGSKPVVTSRPYLISKIEEACTLSNETVGQHIIPARREHADSLKNIIDSERSYAIILVSPHPYLEEPAIDVEYLRMQTLGLAQVVCIDSRSDAYHIGKEIGRVRAAFNGSVNVLHPRKGLNTEFIPHDLLLFDHIEQLVDSGGDPVRKILSLVVHRQNLVHYRRHVSPDKVRRHRLHQRLHNAKLRIDAKEQSAEIQDLLAIYEETNDELVLEVRQMKKTVDNYEVEILTKDELIEEKEQTIRALKYHLAQKAGSPSEANDSPPLRQFSTVDEITKVVYNEMSDRILLQNRAKKSMRESPFESPADVYQAFMLLYNHFYPALKGEGTLDEALEAAEKINIDYAHKMSAVTMGKSSDYSIQYAGRPADMNKHLKIGSSRDPKRCFRIHFEFDSGVGDAGVIVVHHAGKHLETTFS